ncbi:hypothetical protein BCZ83_05040 [Campylobacter upsaliensis]|nr:hypothetical protein [Campylobacter upsaliensis]EAK1171070.1 hypothetical protein [Campylobacter upsaliensis]
MAYKRNKSSSKINEEKAIEFIQGASGETNSDVEKKKKSFVLFMDIDLHKRLKNYITSDEAKRVETQNYIANIAIDEWLTKKGF